MSQHNTTSERKATNGIYVPGVPRNRLMGRAKAAVGKALLVWLASGSVGLAVVAFILFKMMGC